MASPKSASSRSNFDPISLVLATATFGPTSRLPLSICLAALLAASPALNGAPPPLCKPATCEA